MVELCFQILQQNQNLSLKQNPNLSQNLKLRANQKQNLNILPANILIFMMVVEDRKHALDSLINVSVTKVVNYWLPGERIMMNLNGNCSAHLAREAMQL